MDKGTLIGLLNRAESVLKKMQHELAELDYVALFKQNADFDPAGGYTHHTRGHTMTVKGYYSYVKDEELTEMQHELNYLRFFKRVADFGPADADVHALIDKAYLERSNNYNTIPQGWVNED